MNTTPEELEEKQAEFQAALEKISAFWENQVLPVLAQAAEIIAIELIPTWQGLIDEANKIKSEHAVSEIPAEWIQDENN